MSDQIGGAADTVGSALRILHPALGRFVEREMRAKHGDSWERVARSVLLNVPDGQALDVAALLQVIEKNWSTNFVRTLSQNDRGHISELRGVRNQWAHQRPFTLPDTLRALDTVQRLLRAIAASEEASLVGELALSLQPSAAARPLQPPLTGRRGSTRGVVLRSESVSAQAAASWPSEIDGLASAFVRLFGATCKTFGSPSLGGLGICDAALGVQWSAGIALADGSATLGVNLEGMQYDGWPVARLIESELRAPRLPDMASGLPQAGQITLHWGRDCWQAAGRLKIRERSIAPTPMTLDRLTPEAWTVALREAHECLDPSRAYRGRARQVITMAGSGVRAEKEVSPHLSLTVALRTRQGGDGWREAMEAASLVLTPIYEWASEQASR